MNWIDRVPVSVTEWLLGSIVLILSNSNNIHKYLYGNAVQNWTVTKLVSSKKV